MDEEHSFPNFLMQRKVKKETTLLFNQFKKDSTVSQLLNALPIAAALLDESRQIVFLNNSLMEMTPKNNVNELIGTKTGNVLECENSGQERTKCETSAHCNVCGTLNAILESQSKNIRVEKETQVTTMVKEIKRSFDFKITASPYFFNNSKFTLLTIVDLSHEKRRRLLERIFFHDILDKASSLSGLFNLLEEMDDFQKTKKILKITRNLSDELVEEIRAQRTLLDAEMGNLSTNPKQLMSKDFLLNTIAQIAYHQVASNREIKLDPSTQNCKFQTDASLLGRVLTNMLKNALEATPKNGIVTVGCETTKERIRFFVHNQSEISENIRLHIFSRSFSTKGSDRGLGTYSMKLFGETYLKGEVSFKSDPNNGTTFYFDLPLI